MPSFDVVSEVDSHELTNAVDQANRELTGRFDFKGVNAKFTLKENDITLSAPSDFQVKQMDEILRKRLPARGIDVRSLDYKEINTNLAEAKQVIAVKQGIEQEAAKKIIKAIKDQKFKAQGSIQKDQIRVTGKSRDDLQEVIAFLKKSEFDIPLQFTNFRD